MKTYCPFHDDVISRADTVKGYEYAKDQYVVITDEDLASVPLKTVRSIEIEKFVPARPGDDEPVRFVKQAYYVEPEPIGKKAYALLRDVLAEQGLAAICKVVIKDREVLAALNPHAAAMVLETLHWPDEIRATDELDLPAEDVEIKPAERVMAGQLIAGDDRRVRPDGVSRRVPLCPGSRDRGQGRGSRDRGAGRGAGRRPARGPHGRARGERDRSPHGTRNRDVEAAAEEAVAGRTASVSRRPKKVTPVAEDAEPDEVPARKLARRKSA